MSLALAEAAQWLALVGRPTSLTSPPLSPVSTASPNLAKIVVDTPEFGVETMDDLRPMPLWQKLTNGYIIAAPFVAFVGSMIVVTATTFIANRSWAFAKVAGVDSQGNPSARG